ncbi:response regulator [Chryseobacterium taichungense]|uniref:response regulator n=1 Tax=Chryseobacterium taichungense TaxID=295069 RepID=UPI0028A8D341|nr:response regulator [Chryseobacterium taichungense]
MSEKRILIFDNDFILIDALKIIFSENDWVTHDQSMANNALESLELVRPDIVMVDSHYKLGSAEIINLLRHHPDFNKIPVILMSTNNHVLETAQSAGADDYIRKPFSIDELERKIFDLLKDQC